MESAIRAATLADLPALVAMGRRFCAASSYGEAWRENVPAMEALLTRLITGPASVVLVADRADAPVAMLGLLVYPHHVSGVWTAGETVWWVEPEARGIGLRLLRAGERWAAEAGAEQMQMVAPVSDDRARLGAVYTRRGYRAIETTYSRVVPPRLTGLRVHDGVLADFAAYQAAMHRQPFADLVTPPDTVWHGIAPAPDETLPAWITAQYPTLTPTLSLLRQSPAGQAEPNFIHTDRDMGDWTAILYLTRDPVPEDGTTFWRHRPTGAIQSTASEGDALLAEWTAWRDRSQWTPWTTIAARPNRLVIFPAPYFHSRAIEGNVGTGADARLIQLVFGRGRFPPAGAAVCV